MAPFLSYATKWRSSTEKLRARIRLKFFLGWILTKQYQLEIITSSENLTKFEALIPLQIV